MINTEYNFRTHDFGSCCFDSADRDYSKLPDGFSPDTLSELFLLVRTYGTPLFGELEPVDDMPCRLVSRTNSFYIEASHNARGDGDIVFVLRNKPSPQGESPQISGTPVNTIRFTSGITFCFTEDLTAEEMDSIVSDLACVPSEAPEVEPAS